MGFPRKEPWRRLSFSFPGDLPNPEIKPMSLESSVLADRFFYHCDNDSLAMPNYVYFFQCLMDLSIWPLLFISLYVIKKPFNKIDLGYHSPLIIILIDFFFFSSITSCSGFITALSHCRLIIRLMSQIVAIYIPAKHSLKHKQHA